MPGILAGCQLYGDINSELTQLVCEDRFEQFLYDAAESLHISWHGMTVWDVGAHFGYHTFKFASLVGNEGKVLAFEPDPYNLERLTNQMSRNTTLAQRISLQHVALSESDEVQLFKHSSNDAEASILGFLVSTGIPSGMISPETYNRFRETAISVRTADGFVAENTTVIPDIMKIDVEGARVSRVKGRCSTTT